MKVGAVTHSYLWALSISTMDPPHKTDSDQRPAVNQSCFMDFLFGHCGPLHLPPSRPSDEYTVSKAFFPR